MSSNINTKPVAAKLTTLYLLQVHHILETEAGWVSWETNVPQYAELGIQRQGTVSNANNQ